MRFGHLDVHLGLAAKSHKSIKAADVAFYDGYILG